MLNTKKLLALTLTLLFVFALIPAAAQAAPVYRTLDEIKADGTITTYEIKPEDFGFARGTKEDIVGGTPAENAEVTRGILEGKITDVRKSVVCMNAGAAIYVAGKTKTIEEGVGQAKHLIESGAALEKLNQFVEASNK